MKNATTVLTQSFLRTNKLLISYIFILLCISPVSKSWSQTTQTFTASGTFTPPCGVTSITVQCWGAGGGGAGDGVNAGNSGSGGGGGGYSTAIIAVTPGTPIAYTVGLGGAGGGGEANGTAGGNTTFPGVSIAGGGGGGAFNSGAGGVGGTGTIGGGTGSVGGAVGGTGGSGANGGAGGVGSSGTDGTAGSIPGGGGGGGDDEGGGTKSGGVGARGQIIITYTGPNAGPDQTIASCATSTTLAGVSAPSGTTGTWTCVTGCTGVTISDPDLPNSEVTGLTPGTNTTLRWTWSGGGCTSISDDIVINTSQGAGCWTYCASNATTTTYTKINNVQFNEIDNTTAECVGYSDFTQSVYGSARQGQTYSISVTKKNLCTPPSEWATLIKAWIDWNNDGDFADAGEEVLSGSVGAVVGAAAGTVTVPVGAVLGNTRMRCVAREGATAPTACGTYTYGETEDYMIEILPPPSNMAYSSMTFTQFTDTVLAGSFRNAIIGVNIQTTGQLLPISTGNFIFRPTGTTAVANILTGASSVKLYSTGGSGTFATTTLVGSTANPATITSNMTIASSTTLLEGDNYFWLTYDIAPTAPTGNRVDAELVSAVVAAATQTPSPAGSGNPAGSRPIKGSTTMTYVSSTVTQNENPVPKGTTNQQIIGIEVVTSGAITPLTATSFTIRTNGTSVVADAQNIKIFFTADNSTFSTATQFGTTVAVLPAAGTDQVITGSATLNQGINYFWVTYDIKATAGCKPKQVDAQCTSVTVGGVARIPSPTAPAGARTINCGVPYYSKGSSTLVANVLGSWSATRDGTGASPASFAVGNDFYVQNGHSMTTTAAVTIPHLFIETGGYVTASNVISMDNLLIYTGATYEQTVSAVAQTDIDTFTIKRDGTWKHNNNGKLPGVVRYFDPYSIQWFLGIGAGTFPSGTAWGTVIIDITSIGNLIINASSISTIRGNFEIRKWGDGTKYFLLNHDNDMTITGNWIQTGGWCAGASGNVCVAICNCNAAANVDIAVAGDFIMSGGKLEDFNCGDASSTGLNLTIGGNVNITGGTLTLNKRVGSKTDLITTTTSSTWNQTGGTVLLGNTNIKTGKTLTLTGNKMGDIGTGKIITLETGATLFGDVYPISGAGNFTTQDNSTFWMGHASGEDGNVTTTTKTYNAGSNFGFYLTSNQNSGTFVTSAGANTTADPYRLRSLTINKSAGTAVTLQQPLRVTGALTAPVTTNLQLQQGLLTTTTANIIEVDATATANQGSATSYVNGPITKKGSAAFIFPTGKSSYWARIAIGAPSAATDFRAEYFAAPYSNTTTMSTTQGTLNLTHVSSIEHWMLDRVNGTTGAATVKLYWENATRSVIYKCDSLSVGRWNGSAWENASTSLTPTCSYAAAGSVATPNNVPTFSPFTFSSRGAVFLNPLPIELLNFNAVHNGKTVDLTWSTATETNNDYFTIERTKDGKNFEFVAQVDGNGNSVSEINYSVIDEKPYSGVSYYRLKQTDFDNNFKYSPLVSVSTDNSISEVVLHPNPANTLAEIDINATENQISVLNVFDGQGRLVLSKQVDLTSGPNKIKLELFDYSKGMYFITLSTSKELHKLKLIKE